MRRSGLFGLGTMVLMLALAAHPTCSSATDGEGSVLAANGESSPGTVNVLDFGADPTGKADSVAAIEAAFAAAAPGRHVHLRIPAGVYRLGRRVDLAMSGNATNCGVHIEGAGEDVTELFVDNTEGGIRFTGTHLARLSFKISNLSLVALREGSGTAIDFDTANPGVQNARQFTAENLLLRGEKFDIGAFDAGIVVRNAWYPMFQNVKITAPYGPAAGERFRAMRHGILLEDCYSPVVNNCYVWGGENAFSYIARKKQPEDGIITNSYFVGATNGIRLIMTTDPKRWEEPGFHISNCHINYRDRGILIQGLRQANIDHCLFYCNDNQGAAFFGGGEPRDFTPIDIDVAYGSDIIIGDNIFTEPANPRRIAIRIAPESSHVLIRGNQFNLEGTAIQNESLLPSYSSGNIFGGKRDFSKGCVRYHDTHGSLVRSDLN